MCLLLLAYRVHPGYPVIIAANRDEFHEREAEPAHWWNDPPILAGRDVEAGGTWFAVDRGGRVAGVTNYRDPSVREPNAPSRGALPLRALRERDDDSLMAELRGNGSRYNGFNLLFGDASRLCYVSNRGALEADLAPGVYGLSNDVLDTPWPKVRRGKSLLRTYLADAEEPEVASLVDLMDDRWRPRDADLPHTGVGIEWERVLAPMFIVTQRYGTRCSTALTISDRGEIAFLERRFGRDGEPGGDVVERFTVPQPRR